MTEMVSSPRRARSSVKRAASATGRISICRPSVSSASSAGRTFSSSSASCGARLVEPEDGGRAGRAGAADGEPDPVLDRRVLGLAHAPDVAGVDVVLQQRGAGGVDDAHGARRGDLERLVVRAVLLGLLRHQADVRRRAHRRRVERAVLACSASTVSAYSGGVAGVRDHALGVLLLAGGVPALARGADQRRHRGVDDHVARDVQVGDAAVGVDHEEVGPGGERGVDGVLGLGVGARAGWPGRRWGCTSPRPAKTSSPTNARTAWPKMIGSETFIMVALRWTENSTPCALASAICCGEERVQRGAAHDRGVDDLAGQQRRARPSAP